MQQREVTVRVGKLSQSFLNEEDNKNPYSTHEYVEVGSRLLRALTFMNVKMKRFSDTHSYLPVEGDTLCFDMKSLYQSQASGNSKFLWYLSVLEFIAKNGRKYKYCGLVDIDITDQKDLPAVYKEVMTELDHQRYVLRRNCVAWFTGKKGFRIGFIPSEDEGQSMEFLRPLWKKADASAFRPTLQSPYLTKLVDESIYVVGHGVKFDLMHHPVANRLPVFLTGDSDTDLTKILGFYPTSTSELCSICGFWIELFTVLESLLGRSTTTATEEVEEVLLPLTPRTTEIYNDSVVDPLVHVVPITDRNEVHKIAKEMIGDSIGNDPLRVLLAKFYIETKCEVRGPLYRVKLLSGNNIMVISFAIGKDQITCPLHGRKHKHAGKIYVVYIRNALYFSIRCHSTPTSTKEVRVPLFAAEQMITGLSKNTQDLISPFTVVVNAPFIGDMLVKDSRFINKEILLLRSAMGSGKTVAIASLIKEMQEKIGDSFRLLVISTRRTCMMMLSEMFSVARYLNSSDNSVRNDIHQMDRIVLSMESLHKLIPNGSVNIIKRFDLVILDECESILANFSSVTMQHKRRNYQLLKAILETDGTRAVLSDAFLGECTLQFFLKTGLSTSKQWSFIVNTHNKSTTQYELFTSDTSGSFIHDYETAVLQNQRFIFASDRIDAIVYFQDLLVTFLGHEGLKKKSVLTITAGSAPDVIASASDCKSWEDHDYIFYSPAMTVGNSYAPQDPGKRFDLVFGLFTGTTTTLDAIQMTGRARSLKRSVAKILLTQTSVVDGEEFVGKGKDVSDYIESRINTASDELGQILRADRNKTLTKLMAEQIPGSQLVTDLSSSAESILVVPKDTQTEELQIKMPVPYLETIFIMNVINERKSKFTQLEHWSAYLSTTYLPFKIIRRRDSLKKKPPSILSTIMSKKKQIEERRRLAGDEYSSDLILSGEELKKRKEEDTVMSDITTDEINIRKIQSVLGKHASPDLSLMIQKIQTGNVSQVKDLPVNWDKLHQFVSSHVSVDCLERFYFFLRNIERPIGSIKSSELLGTMFKSTSEFIGRGSIVLSHVKPIYDNLIKDLIRAAFHLRNKTTTPEPKEWISPDKNNEFVYLDITSYFCLNTETAYTILCEFLNAKDAIQEESVYYHTQPLKSSASKNLRLTMTKVLSRFPEIGFAAGIGEFQKLNIPSKSCSLMSICISGFALILTTYFRNLFGAFFQKISWKDQKELGFSDQRRRYQGIRSTRLRFRDDIFENSKSLVGLLYEDKMEFSPTYPFFDMIV